MAEEALRDLTSLRSNVFGPQPKTPAQPAPQIAQQELVGRIQRGQRAEQAIPELGEMESQATEQKIRAQQAVRTGVAAEQLKQEQAFGGREKSALETRQAGVMAEPEFKPDKMELDDYRNLAGMLIGIGTLVGGKGKMGAMYSLQALNGMMKGYAEGRKDLFKTQQIEFEKALKSVDAHNKRIDREFNDAMSLINTDRRTALAKLKQLEAELGDGVMAADLRLNDLGKLRKDIDSAVKSSDNALKIIETNRQKELDREARAEQAREMRELRRDLANQTDATRRELALLKQQQGSLKPGADVNKKYVADNVLLADINDLRRDLEKPGLPEKIGAERLYSFLSENGPISNQLLQTERDPDVRQFMMKVSRMRNKYYASTSGLSVTQSEAMRNYGAVVQPGDTPQVTKEKLEIMSKGVQDTINVYRQMFTGLPEIKVTPGMDTGMRQGEQLNPYQTASPITMQAPSQPAAQQMPKRPTGVPESAGWSPSAGKWFWKDADGKIQSKPGD